MSDTVIKIENLGKKYRISHNQPQRYFMFRDTLAYKAKRLMERFVRPPGAESSPASSVEDFWALKDVSFEVKQGERVGIIGRNGAGKSTLLKILSRITEPTTGRVSIKGRIASLLEVGTGFHAELTGRENIFLNGAILGMSKAEIKKNFDAIVDFSGVEQFLDTPVKRYSSGMYVRLAFAVAAHLDTEILLVDEVLAVGDAEFQKKCMGKMDEVSHKQGRTILFVSHNMGAIRQLCDRGIVLSSSQLSFQGTAKEAADRYNVGLQSASSIEITENMHALSNRRYVNFKSANIMNSRGELTTHFHMGDLVRIELEFECLRPVTRMELGIAVRDSIGSPVHFYTSSWEGLLLDLEQETYVVRVDIPQILLLPGKYILSCWASRDGEYSDDNIPVLFTLDIDEKDIKGNIKRYSLLNTYSKYSVFGTIVYAESEWKIL